MPAQPEGNLEDAPPARDWPRGWMIPRPDLVVSMPKPVDLPAQGDIDYTYEIVPTGFTEGKWVQMSEIQPSSRANVHHAVVYVRPPGSNWLRHAPDWHAIYWRGYDRRARSPGYALHDR